MYSNSPYNYNQSYKAGTSQSKSNTVSDEDTSFGYPMAPSSYGTMQSGSQPKTGGQTGTGQQMQVPMTGAAPVDYDMIPTTPVLDVEYTQGYLKTQIGKRIKVEFLIGTNMLIDREGTLIDVGISYIVIREVDTNDLLLCDIYSIKFVRFFA